MGGLRESVVPSEQFKSLFGGISSGFPLANHFDLSDSESVFGISQGPPRCVCVCVHMCQSRWIPAKSSMGRLDVTLLWTSKELSSWGSFLDFESENYVASYLGRAQPPLSIVLLLIFQSSYPQTMNSSHSPCGEKGISFLNMIAKQVKYGLKNSKYLLIYMKVCILSSLKLSISALKYVPIIC